MKQDPLIKGGQGRSAETVKDNALAVVVCMALACAVVIGLVIGSVFGGM
jgi:hypothetical protein